MKPHDRGYLYIIYIKSDIKQNSFYKNLWHVMKQVAHAIETHNSDNNIALPKLEHKMECVLWACDELSGLLGAAVFMYPSHSAQNLNLKSVKKKFKGRRFAVGCDRDNIRRSAELNGMELDDLFNSMIGAYQATND